MEADGIHNKRRLFAVVLTVILATSMIVVILQLRNSQFLLNPQNPSPSPKPSASPTNSPLSNATTPFPTPPTPTPSGGPTPYPTIQPGQLTITSVVCSPPSLNPGQQAAVMVNVDNQGQMDIVVLVTLQVKEPDGNLMPLPQNSQEVSVKGNSTQLVMFPLNITMDEQLGTHQINAEIYDPSHTTQYYTTGFTYSFNVFLAVAKIQFTVSPNYISPPLMIDSITYAFPQNFTWYLGSTHLFNVPQTIPIDATHSWKFMGWSDGNQQSSRQFTATNNYSFTAIYAPTPNS